MRRRSPNRAPGRRCRPRARHDGSRGARRAARSRRRGTPPTRPPRVPRSRPGRTSRAAGPPTGRARHARPRRAIRGARPRRSSSTPRPRSWLLRSDGGRGHGPMPIDGPALEVHGVLTAVLGDEVLGELQDLRVAQTVPVQGRSGGVRQQMGALVLGRDRHVMTGRASGFGLQIGVRTDGQLVGDREVFVAAGRTDAAVCTGSGVSPKSPPARPFGLHLESSRSGGVGRGSLAPRRTGRMARTILEQRRLRSRAASARRPSRPRPCARRSHWS